jgi:hypothetical protein
MGRRAEDLINLFADAVVAQDECITRGNAREGNRHAEKYRAAARRLLDGGELTIEVFCSLLEHPNVSVQAMAAAFLLKARTERAVAALKPIAEGRGLAAFGAKMTLARYERGDLEIR